MKLYDVFEKVVSCEPIHWVVHLVWGFMLALWSLPAAFIWGIAWEFSDIGAKWELFFYPDLKISRNAAVKDGLIDLILWLVGPVIVYLWSI